jgi:UDP-glucose 4-epimerase
MKCLVVGAAGYLGRHLTSALRAHGHEVVECPMHEDPQSRRVDVGDLRTLSGLDWEVDLIFVFAGVTGTSASFTDYEAYVRSNEIGLLNILECIRRSQSRARVIFPSSRLVYKGSERPLPETAELEAKTVYAATKIGCEYFLRAYANAFGIPYTVFRVCVPYGNSHGGEYSYGTVGNFIRQAMEDGRIRLFGDGGQRRTFTHVDDLCQAVILGSMRDDFENETFNVPGEDLSLFEAAGLVAAQLDADIEFVAWPSFDLAIESGSTVFDGGKLLARLPGVVKRSMTEWANSIAPHIAD